MLIAAIGQYGSHAHNIIMQTRISASACIYVSVVLWFPPPLCPYRAAPRLLLAALTRLPASERTTARAAKTIGKTRNYKVLIVGMLIAQNAGSSRDGNALARELANVFIRRLAEFSLRLRERNCLVRGESCIYIYIYIYILRNAFLLI